MSKFRGGAAPPEFQCTGQRRAGRGRCRAWAVTGTTVCRMHGGTSPQVKAKKARLLAEKSARHVLTEIGVTPLGDPLLALEDLAAEAMTLRSVLADRVAELEQENAPSAAILTHWRLWTEALDRAQRFVTTLAGLDLDTRRVAIAERQAVLVADVIRRVLDDPDLGLSDEQRRIATSASARHLRLVAADGDAA